MDFSKRQLNRGFSWRKRKWIRKYGIVHDFFFCRKRHTKYWTSTTNSMSSIIWILCWWTKRIVVTSSSKEWSCTGSRRRHFDVYRKKITNENFSELCKAFFLRFIFLVSIGLETWSLKVKQWKLNTVSLFNDLEINQWKLNTVTITSVL